MEGGIDTALTSRLRQSVGEKCRGGRGGGSRNESQQIMTVLIILINQYIIMEHGKCSGGT